MKSWKTSLGGLLVAVGTVASQVLTPAWVPVVGSAMVALGSVVMGVSARDNKVNSKDAGAE